MLPWQTDSFVYISPLKAPVKAQTHLSFPGILLGDEQRNHGAVLLALLLHVLQDIWERQSDTFPDMKQEEMEQTSSEKLGEGGRTT